MRGEHISFYVVFVAAVYWEIITIGVDYTDFEEERLREKKVFVCFPHHLRPTTEREKKYCVRNKNETVFKF